MRDTSIYRITHRQIFAQLTLSLMAPMGMFLIGNGHLSGLVGIGILLLGTFLWCGFTFFLVRAGGILERSPGLGFWGTMPYLVFSCAFLLHVFTREVRQYDQIDLDPAIIGILVILIGWINTGSLPRRGRMAGFIFPIFMTLLAGGILFFLRDITAAPVWEFDSRQYRNWPWTIYLCLCALGSGSLLTMSFSQIEKPRSLGRTLFGAYGFLALVGIIFLVSGECIFGSWRMLWEEQPVMLLLGGWQHVFLLGLLFSIGSLLFYGKRTMTLLGKERYSWILPVLVFLLGTDVLGKTIEEYYPQLLGWLLFPLLLVTLIYGMLKTAPKKEIGQEEKK